MPQRRVDAANDLVRLLDQRCLILADRNQRGAEGGDVNRSADRM
jgi:hypothetical protein